MQVPGYRHLKVDDDSGGSGNPYDVRPRPKKSREKSTKNVVDIYSIREPEIKRAGAKRLRPLDGVIVVSENLRGTPSIKLQIEILGSPSPGGRQRARRSPLFFLAVEIPPIGEFQLRLKLKPRGTLEWNSSIRRDGHFQHSSRCVGWQQLKLRYLPTMDPLHCFRLVKRLADGIDTIVALAAGLAKSIRRPVGLFRQQSRCITRT